MYNLKITFKNVLISSNCILTLTHNNDCMVFWKLLSKYQIKKKKKILNLMSLANYFFKVFNINVDNLYLISKYVYFYKNCKWCVLYEKNC